MKNVLLITGLVAVVVVLGVLVGQGGITGAATTIACFENQDCDDRISSTEDVCKNPGTEYSLCVNRPK